MDIEDAIYGRRSIRNFTEEKIPMDVLKKIIHAGTYAPSACNFQAWKFIVINDEDVKNKIVSGGWSDIIKKSPQGILVVYRNDIMVTGWTHKDYIQSAAAAIENMLLMAYSLGVASCWICHLPPSEDMRPILNIPNNYDVIAYVALGYPVQGTGSNKNQMLYHYGSEENFKLHKRRFSEEQVICYNRFETVPGDSAETDYGHHKEEKSDGSSVARDFRRESVLLKIKKKLKKQ